MGFPQILPEASIPSQWQQVMCEVFRQLRVDISVTTTTLSSQDVAHELLRLRDDSSHGQTVRSSGSTTGSGQDEGSLSTSRSSLQDIQIVNEREIRLIGAVGQESSGSTQAHDANFQNFSNDLTAYSVSSTSQNAPNGPLGVPSWQNEWNCLASQATPGHRWIRSLKPINIPFPRKTSLTAGGHPALGYPTTPLTSHNTTSKNNFIVCRDYN